METVFFLFILTICGAKSLKNLTSLVFPSFFLIVGFSYYFYLKRKCLEKPVTTGQRVIILSLMDNIHGSNNIIGMSALQSNRITVDAGYKNTGYKNISVIRTIVCDPYLFFPIEKYGYKNISDIRAFFSTPDSVLITGIFCTTGMAGLPWIWISMDGYRGFGHIHGYCGYPRPL